MQLEKHHAIVFEGHPNACHEAGRSYIEQTLGLTYDQNPDITREEYTGLGVDDARAIKERAAQAPLGAAQVFLLRFDTSTREAQNALLKLLEEPASNTHFVLSVPTIHILLPTVRSRLAYGGRCTELTREHDALAFLKARPSERLTMLAKTIENKDKQAAAQLLDSIEALVHKDPGTHASALKELALVRTYLRDRSSSLKLLLEHLAVTLEQPN